MQRVAVARQRADGQARVLDHRPVVAGRAGVVEQRREVEVVVPRPAAGAELDRLHVAQGQTLRQHRPDIQAAEHRREHAQLHRVLLTSVHTPPCRWLSSTRVHDTGRAVAVLERGHRRGAGPIRRSRPIDDGAIDVAADVGERIGPGLLVSARQMRIGARVRRQQRRILGDDRARLALPIHSSFCCSWRQRTDAAAPFSSNQRSFLWPAQTWPTETQPLAAALEPQQDAGQVLAADGVVLGGDAAIAGKRLARRSRLLPHRHDRRQVGEHRFDAPPEHVLDQVHPVRADVAEGEARAALLGLEAPREVGRLQQPVLQIGAVDEMDRAELAARDHLPRLLHHRVAAVVEHHGVDDAGSARRLPHAALPPTSSPAASRTGRACPPPARPGRRGRAARWGW